MVPWAALGLADMDLRAMLITYAFGNFYLDVGAGSPSPYK
jgi:hypothetical protein